MRHRSRFVARRALARPHTAIVLLALSAFGGCSAPPGTGLTDDDDVPDYQGPLPSGASSTSPAPSGAGASTPPGSNDAPVGPSSAPSASSGEQNPASGAPLSPSGGNTGNTGSNGGPSDGAAGSSMVPPPDGNQGAGGSSMGGEPPSSPPAAPPPDNQPPVNQPPPPPAPPPPAPAGPDIPCPADATFCSGFESGMLPNTASFQSNPVAQLQFDTSVRRSGNQSMVLPAASGGFNVREVIVPIPGQQFWARLFVQTSTQFGDGDHDSLFVASTATPAQDNNDEHGPEFSEQANQVLLNADDNPLAGANGPGFPQAPGPQLSANTWHCLEAFYDGGNGDVQIFSDGQLLIDAPAFKPVTFQTFRFGYIQFNTPRTIWFDDVVVAPDRVGCN